MKKKMALALGGVALVATLAIGGTLAYFTDTDAAANVFTMGKVGIDLTEDSDSDKVVDITEEGITYDDIVPGDVVSKRPTISVDADSQDCYVAATIEVSASSEDLDVSEVSFDVDTTKWTLVNGVYYYNEKLSANDSVDLFTETTIPTGWENEFAGQTFTVSIKAYAIQAENVSLVNEDGSVNEWVNDENFGD